MMEDLYAKPDLSRRVPAQIQETEKETTPAHGDHGDRNTPIYDNNVSQRNTEDMVEEQQTGTGLSIRPSVCVCVCLPYRHTHTNVCVESFCMHDGNCDSQPLQSVWVLEQA